MHKVQRIGVSGFCTNVAGELLIAKRSKKEKFLPEFWELIGGKVKFGEEPRHALMREFEEETSLRVAVAVAPYYLFSYTSNSGREHVVDLVYQADLTVLGGTVVLSEEHDEARWVSEHEFFCSGLQITEKMLEAVRAGFHQIHGFK
jgi:8-oxo-dGTP pyrophosphatase MutT (NUDIX family)